jgi:hypothetical protein
VLTGVIYGAIVVVWAAYLVPLALRRHDEASRSRSIARFSSAMRVLARRGPGGATAIPSHARVVLTPKTKGQGPRAPESAPLSPRMTTASRPSRAAERAAAARRRQVLAVLAGLTTMVVLVSLVGWLPSWSVVLPLALVVTFLTIARRSVRNANEAYWLAAAAAPEPGTSVVVRRSAVRVDASKTADEDEPTVTLTAADRQQAVVAATDEHVVAVKLETPAGATLWDPLPVTLPAYVGAPAAKRSIRTIELKEPSAGPSGQFEEHIQPVGDAAPSPASAMDSPASSPVDDGQPDPVARVVNG